MKNLDKDEILRRAQAQKGEDELEQQVEEQASRNSFAAGGVVFLILFFLKYYANQPFSDISALLFTMLSVQYFYKWYRLRNRRHLYYSILFSITGVLNMVAYVRQLFF